MSLIQSVLYREVSLIQSVLYREVSLIQSVLYREVPLCNLSELTYFKASISEVVSVVEGPQSCLQCAYNIGLGRDLRRGLLFE